MTDNIDQASDAGEATPPTESYVERLIYDALFAIAEHFRMLVLLPSVAAILAYAISPYVPRLYESQALMRLPDSAIASAEPMLRSNLILDEVVSKHPSIKGTTAERRRRNLSERISWGFAAGTSSKNTTFYSLSVADKKPEEAQSINNTLISAWLNSMKPGAEAKVRLEEQVQREEERVKSTNSLIDKYVAEMPSLISPNSIQGELATSISSLRGQRDRYVENLVAAKQALLGGSRDWVLSPPSLPTEHIWRRDQITLTVANLTLVGLLLGILARVALSFVMVDPRYGSKARRLLSALIWPFKLKS